MGRFRPIFSRRRRSLQSDLSGADEAVPSSRNGADPQRDHQDRQGPAETRGRHDQTPAPNASSEPALSASKGKQPARRQPKSSKTGPGLKQKTQWEQQRQDTIKGPLSGLTLFLRSLPAFIGLISVVVAVFFLGGWQRIIPEEAYELPDYGEAPGWWREWVCNNLLDENCFEPNPDLPNPPSADIRSSAVLTELSVLKDWIVESDRAFVLENKFRALDITFSNRSESNLNTDNNFLGLYEAFGPDERSAEAGTHFLIAGSNGDYDARQLYEDLNPSEPDRRKATNNLVELHKLFGAEGYYRLGHMYLGDLARDRNYPGYPADESLLPKFWHSTANPFKNNFIVSAPDFKEAYINMHIAVLCNYTDATQWRGFIADAGGLSRGEEQDFQREGHDRLSRRGNITSGGVEDVCNGNTFQKRIDMLTQDAVIWRFLNDNQPWPTFDALIEKLALSEVEFRQWIGLLTGGGSLAGPRTGQGSQYYRNSPGAGSQGGVDTPASDGLPDECIGLPAGTECPARIDALACRDAAASQLNLGKAYLSTGNIGEARRHLQAATDVGRACQAEAAREAARLLQSLNLTCEYTQDSLARIARDAENNPEGGAVIGLHARQRALAVHGYYEGNIDGKYGPMTREAARAFQQAYSFSQTGDLTPIETVYLICSAAEVKDHAPSMNTLGVMYVTGLGVVQNTDAGLDWLRRAEALGDVNAKYNLALIYGTGVAASSYLLCDVPENMQIADSYLVEAANLGHPKAIQWIAKYGALTVSERWAAIKTDLVDRRIDADGAEFHEKRMTAIGEGCRPNP